MSYCTKCGKEVEAGRVMCQECIDAYNQGLAKQNEYLPGNKRDGIFAIILFGIAALLVDCLLFAGFGIGTSISLILLTIFAAIYLKNEKGISLYAIVTAVLSIVSSAAITLSNDGLAVFLSFALTLVLYTVMIFEISNKRRGNIGTIKSSLKLFYDSANSFFCNLGQGAYAIFKIKDKNGEEQKSNIGKIILGLALAVPVLIIVVPLLVSSDQAFESLISKINGRTVFEIITVVLLGFLLLIMLFGQLFTLKNSPKKEDTQTGFKGIDSVIITSFLSVISVVYLLYLLSQLAYFFDGFMGVLPIEFTAAEYARRGFFEICIITAINLTIVALSFALCKKTEKGLPVILKIICSFLSVFSLLLDATAIAKMVMYVKRFGFTRLRLFTTVFMVFLAILFIVAIFKLYIKNLKYMKTVLVVGTVFVLALTFFNVDGFISNYNVNAYLKEDLKTVDINAIDELPTLSKVDGLITLYQNAKEQTVVENAKWELKRIYSENFFIKDNKFVKKDKDIRNFNLYDMLAEKKLLNCYNDYKNAPTMHTYC